MGSCPTLCLVMTPPPSSVSQMSTLCVGSVKTNEGGRRIHSPMVRGGVLTGSIAEVDVGSSMVRGGVSIGSIAEVLDGSWAIWGW